MIRIGGKIRRASLVKLIACTTRKASPTSRAGQDEKSNPGIKDWECEQESDSYEKEWGPRKTR